MSAQSIPNLRLFCFAMLFDLVSHLASSIQPIRFKTETNQGLVPFSRASDGFVVVAWIGCSCDSLGFVFN